MRILFKKVITDLALMVQRNLKLRSIKKWEQDPEVTMTGSSSIKRLMQMKLKSIDA